jgi:circadian clock protein KaiB
MTMSAPGDAALNQQSGDLGYWELTLFVTGASDLSARAIANARQICERNLHGCYQLTVIDLHEDPAAVLRSQILAAPTLVRNLPLPVRRIVGDLSKTEKVLAALQIPASPDDD